jgi:hypothetical protein
MLIFNKKDKVMHWKKIIFFALVFILLAVGRTLFYAGAFKK